MYCQYCGKLIDDEYCDCDDEWEDDFEEDDWYEQQEEMRLEELDEKAATCTCGAYEFSKSGSVVHIADCCCGAE